MKTTLKQIARILDAQLIRGQDEDEIEGVTGLGVKQPNKLGFYFDANVLYKQKLSNSYLAGLVTTKDLLKNAEAIVPKTTALLTVDDPKEEIINALNFFAPSEHLLAGEQRLSAQAAIGKGTTFGKDTVIGRAVIGNNCRIGDHCHIASGVHLGDNVIVGNNCTLYPNVTVYANTQFGKNNTIHAGCVIGADGFGYIQHKQRGAHTKMMHLGSVVIEDDVEIGSNSSIDRGTMNETQIGTGTKIDSQVHIGHNVKIGKNVIVCACSGIGGSATIGDDTIIAGLSAIRDGIVIGKRNRIYGGSVVIKSTPDDAHLFGSPAGEKSKILKEKALTARLPEFFQRLLECEGFIAGKTPKR